MQRGFFSLQKGGQRSPGAPPRKKTNEETAQIARLSDWEALFRARMKHIAPVHVPLTLISQIQRSGGTLLSQLFDGHPECHAHPHELHIGPTKAQWPELDLKDNPERWFEILFETPTARLFREGYQKYGEGRDEQPETFPFLLLPSLQKEIFFHCLAHGPVASRRQVLDAYMTSYFNAWLNNQNLSGRKRVITAFTARLAMYEDSVERFFADYPDGKLISILRQPHGWWVSARKHLPREYADATTAIDLWKESTAAMIRNRRKYEERVCVITFEDLVGRTEPIMRHLARYVGIQFNTRLLTPTFNKSPIKANSSYLVERHGVINEPIARYTELLSASEMRMIDDLVGDLYDAARRETVPIAASPPTRAS